MHPDPISSRTSGVTGASLTSTIARLLAALAALIAVPSAAQRPPAVPECTLAAEPWRRLRLSDGATVSVDAMGASRNGAELAVVGRTIVWLLPSQIGADSIPVRFGLGVIRDRRGEYRYIPFPPGIPSEPTDPRIVSAGRRGWHLVFVSGRHGTTGNPLAHDSATVWYGRFDGTRWRDVQAITRASTATFLVSFASGVVRTPDGLAFVFPFDRSTALKHNRRGTQGLVLLRLHGRRWTADTLLTWEVPRAVDIVSRGDTVLAVFTQSVFANGRPQRDALYAARHLRGWEEPTRWLDAAPHLVTWPQLAADDRRRPLAVTYRIHDLDTWEQRLSWGVETAGDPPFQPRDSIAMTDPGDRPAFFRDDAGRLYWVVRDGRTHERLRVFTARDTLIDLGTVAAPFHNARVIGAPLPDGRLMVFTVSLDATPGEPQAFSAATAFAVTCSTPPTRR